MKFSNNEIISKIGISKSTFYRNIEDLLKDGAVKKISGGYSISTLLFPIFNNNQKIEEFKAELDKMAQIDKDFKNDRVYKAFYYYYDKGFEGLRIPLKDFPNQLVSGIFFIKDKTPARNKKNDEQTVYHF